MVDVNRIADFPQDATPASTVKLLIDVGSSVYNYSTLANIAANMPAITMQGALNANSNAISGVTTLGTTDAITASGSNAALNISNNASGHTDIRIKHAITNSEGAVLRLGKSRGDIASPSIINTTDETAAIKFDAYDGNSYEVFAQILAQTDGAIGDGDMPGKITFQTAADGGTTLGTVLTLSADKSATFAGAVSLAAGQVFTSNRLYGGAGAASGQLYISTGTATNSGANIRMDGASASGTENDMQFRAGNTPWLSYDASAGAATFAGALSGVTTLGMIGKLTVDMPSGTDWAEFDTSGTSGEVTFRNDMNSAGNKGIMYFGQTGVGDFNRKTAIINESTGSWNRASLYFCLNNDTNTDNADITDVVLKLNPDKSATFAGDVVHNGMVNMGTATELTISGGVVAATKSYHTVDTEADAASDDLDTINGDTAGDILIIRAASSARTVVVKHATGNMYLAGGADFSLDHGLDTLTLISADGTNWAEISRSSNA